MRRIPLLVRRGGRDIKKDAAKPSAKRKRGSAQPKEKLERTGWSLTRQVQNRIPKHGLVSDHSVCGAKVGFAEIFLLPQPPLLTRRGMRLLQHISNND
jgi:hypothetical protein